MVKKTDCVKTIIKVAENNVEVTYSLKNESGEDIVIDDLTGTFGQERIDDQLIQAEFEKAKWDAMDSTEINKQKATAQKEIDDLALIQTEMDKVLK